MIFEKLNCHTCTEEDKSYRGCGEKGNAIWEFNKVRYTQCPIRLVSKQTWMYLKLYPFFVKGLLYANGGLSNQPSKYLDCMDIISLQYEEHRE